MTGTESRTIKVGALARVEGEGALDIKIRDGVVTWTKFRIHEPPRFFEALLRGRMFWDAPDTTSRICGICPIAYILSASKAMEDALGVRVSEPIENLRRLVYCGEWIQSHVLHAAMLHAPDFLGLDDALSLADTDPELLKDALALKAVGNQIMQVVGGRPVHPVNLKVGGFFSAPSRADVRELIAPLERGLDKAMALTRRFSRFAFPDFEADYSFVSLACDGAYPLEAGRVVRSNGLEILVDQFLDHFEEDQSRHSNALTSTTRAGEPYLVGPLARYANNFACLSPRARARAEEAGLKDVCRNPYKSLLVRMIEVVYACEEALRLAESYEAFDPACIDITPGPGTGHGATEAPRGICYHRYALDDDGRIITATIVPPTAQNQLQIEADLRAVVESHLHFDDEQLKLRCEQTIRNYDPCISCATHAIRVHIDRD
ncbi:MAG: Ni/Fe hydrogenase subunit alpha [Hyphomicrobiales bacterium]|nr:Ni/Fe hydrogenase subunit alpha [Hyphomicrobiales bacterium]